MHIRLILQIHYHFFIALAATVSSPNQIAKPEEKLFEGNIWYLKLAIETLFHFLPIIMFDSL